MEKMLIQYILTSPRHLIKLTTNLLLQKLHLYKIHPKLINWIQSFLADQTQIVLLDGHMSLLALIISGVPQGTVLGPILFLIFINNINNYVINATICWFADDTRILKSIASSVYVQLRQEDLNKVMSWSSINNMTLHMDKFKLLFCVSDKNNTLTNLPFICEQFQYTVSNLTPIPQVRDLGILFPCGWSWSSHIQMIADKSRKMAACVFNVFATRKTPIMLTVYKSLVRSQLEYCSPFLES